MLERANDFFRLEAAGGIFLIFMAVLAMIVANTPWAGMYHHLLNEVEVGIILKKTPLHWINDALMAVFFFMVGLEIKREMAVGALASRAQAVLPMIAAAGGMLVPALFYWAINSGNPETLRGWAISSATDIAFALGVLSLLGSRVPVSLKVLLTAIAIIDDLGAILIIALFYTDHISMDALLAALIPVFFLFVLNRRGVQKPWPYIVFGLILWVAVLKSGLHATMAGVLAALFIPVKAGSDHASPAERLEHALHPWVVFGVLPVFAFANAGVSLGGVGLDVFSQPVTLGIIAGLLFGKQIGIFAGLFLAIRAGFSSLPEGASWRHLYGVSILCGIGFTMSLFIGGLAFTGGEMQAEVRIGVLSGSFISALAAYILLATRQQKME